MTDEQINRAIAEACGWKWHDHPDCMAKKIDWTMPEKWIMRPDGVLVFRHDIPDYCSDLNSMHEAEEHCLRGNGFNAYALMIHGLDGSLFGIRATARQRAETLLRLLAKWEEVQA